MLDKILAMKTVIGTCAFCKQEGRDLRPFGPNDEEICVECGKKDPQTTALKAQAVFAKMPVPSLDEVIKGAAELGLPVVVGFAAPAVSERFAENPIHQLHDHPRDERKTGPLD